MSCAKSIGSPDSGPAFDGDSTPIAGSVIIAIASDQIAHQHPARRTIAGPRESHRAEQKRKVIRRRARGERWGDDLDATRILSTAAGRASDIRRYAIRVGSDRTELDDQTLDPGSGKPPTSR